MNASYTLIYVLIILFIILKLYAYIHTCMNSLNFEKGLMTATFCEFQIIILPQGTDMNTIEYKLQTKNIHQYSEQNFNSTLRHHSTAYNNDLDEQLFTENTVVITGKVEKVPLQETVLPTQIWSKEYKQTVKGTVDLSAEGRVINPTITSYSELPDALVKLAPTPDQVGFLISIKVTYFVYKLLQFPLVSSYYSRRIIFGCNHRLNNRLTFRFFRVK